MILIPWMSLLFSKYFLSKPQLAFWDTQDNWTNALGVNLWRSIWRRRNYIIFEQNTWVCFLKSRSGLCAWCAALFVSLKVLLIGWYNLFKKTVLSFYFHLCYVTNYAVDALLLSYCISLNFCFLVMLLFTVLSLVELLIA